MKIARPLARLIEAFEKLPGIGPKSAQRLAYYSLRVPQTELTNFAEALEKLKKDTVLCSICKNIAENDPCSICEDSGRDKSTILVLEEPLEILSFERTGKYNGLYHILHGAISPLENIGPDELYIEDLLKRIKKENSVKEVIIATNPNMEGEATAMYLTKEIRKLGRDEVRVTRLGMGIPTGADLEYADEITLTQAIMGRREL